MRYYYADHDNAVQGPLDLSELGALFSAGAIDGDTHVIPEGETEWVPYGRVAKLLPPPASLTLAVPAPVVVQPARIVPPMPTMPTMRRCPFCDEEISLQAKKCKHCGEILDVTLRAAEEAKRGASTAPPPPMVFMNSSSVSAPAYAPPVLVMPAKSGAVAALLNLLLPGLGYMYCGRVVLGGAVFLFTLVAGVLTFGLALLILYPVLVIDGFLAASRANRRLLTYR